MTIFPYLLILIMSVALMIDLKRGIMLAVIFRPVVDCFWGTSYSVLGYRPTQVISVVVPTLIFFGILFSRDKRLSNAPLSTLWFIYIFYQFFNMGLILFTGQGLIAAIDFYMRVFNGFIGYFMIQEVFRTEEDLKKILIAIIIAGLFPLAQSVYQNVLGGTIRSQLYMGQLVRNIGFYHDAVTMRVYCFQTLAGILLYWDYFIDKKQYITKGILIGMTLTVVMTIYKLFSKAGFLILGIWIAIWFVSRKKYMTLVLLLLVAVGASLVWGGDWWSKIETVYTLELDAMEGDVGVQRTLTGRWSLWQRHLDDWMELPIYMKLFGGGKGMFGSHNDYLRVLTSTGIFGLIIYLLLLGAISLKILKKWLYDRNPLIIMSLMLITMWGADSMGLDPGAYSSYQWFAWGLIGLGLRGIETSNVPEQPDNMESKQRVTL